MEMPAILSEPELAFVCSERGMDLTVAATLRPEGSTPSGGSLCTVFGPLCSHLASSFPEYKTYKIIFTSVSARARLP